MLVSAGGQFVIARGEHQGNSSWRVDVTRGVFGPPSVIQALSKPTIKINIAPFSRNTRADMSFWQKTANFACRALSGAASAAIPFVLRGAYQTWAGAAPTLSATGDAVLLSTGLGLLAASVSDGCNTAFNRGLQFGSVAQAAAFVSQEGEGVLWNRAVELKDWSGAQLTSAGDKVVSGWNTLTSLFKQKIHTPTCNWLGDGRVANLINSALFC